MNVAYCPKCKTARLRWVDDHGQPRVTDDRPSWRVRDGRDRWCPQCKEWVKPEMVNQEAR